MKKSTKRITTFNLDTTLVDEFDSFCAAEDKTRSKVANRIIDEYVKARKKTHVKRTG